MSAIPPLPRWPMWLPIFWALTQVPCAGQELRTTPSGEKIIVYADGTARYFNDLSPVTLAEGEDAAYPILSVDIEPLGEALTPTEADLRRIAERRLNLAREALTLAGTRASAASENRVRIRGELDRARAAGNLTAAGQLERQLTLAQTVERDAATEERDARAAVEANRTTIERGNYVAAYNERARQNRARTVAAATPPARQDRQLSLLLPREPDFTGYGPASARAGLRAPLPCQPSPAVTASNGAAALTPLLPFFSFTEENLRPFLDGQEYLTASAYVSQSADATAYLHLKFTFSNPSARNAYGTLPAGPSLTIQLLDGHTLVLPGQRESVGILNHARGTLEYDVDYPLRRNDLALLQREAIDFVRVLWSGGYEEYPVYRVDAIKLMTRCL